MKITKKLREEAALLCDLAASAKWHIDDLGPGGGSSTGIERLSKDGPTYRQVAEQAGISADAEALARWAWTKTPGSWTRALDAEVAQLLREGWTPPGVEAL